MTHFSAFRTVNAPGVTLYQRPEQSTLASPEVPFTRMDFPVADVPANKRVHPTLADARGHADRGAWEDAARCCEQLLERDNLNSAVHFNHGLILEQLKKHAEAMRSLRAGHLPGPAVGSGALLLRALSPVTGQSATGGAIL